MTKKLKCWKRLGNGGKEWGEEYFKVNDKYSYAKSFKTGLDSKEIKRRGIKPHIFMGRIGRDGKESKEYFKTKKESDKAMINYMKKHNQC